MKKALNTIIVLLAVILMVVFIFQPTADTQSEMVQVTEETTTEVETNYLSALNQLEEQMKSVYGDESEETIDLTVYKEVSEGVSQKLSDLEEAELTDEEQETYNQLQEEWVMIESMAYVTFHLTERFVEGEIIDETPLPEDFEQQLDALKESKPEFYERYKSLYDSYLLAVESTNQITEENTNEEEIDYIYGLLLNADRTINQNLSIQALNDYYARLELLGDTTYSTAIANEINRRQNEEVEEAASEESEYDGNAYSGESNQDNSYNNNSSSSSSGSSWNTYTPPSSPNNNYEETSYWSPPISEETTSEYVAPEADVTVEEPTYEETTTRTSEETTESTSDGYRDGE